jgi:PPOX class probable F420-dependent enzyme
MDITAALEWAAGRRTGVLITLRRDGRAQSSDIAYAVLDGVVKVSVTADRAKTHNARRDPRVILHVTDPASWSYVSIDAHADVSAPATHPSDEVVDELVTVYRSVAGEHDDWDEFRRAMVADRRCVLALTPRSVTGHVR